MRLPRFSFVRGSICLLLPLSAGAQACLGVTNLTPVRVLGTSGDAAIGFPDGFVRGGSFSNPYISNAGHIYSGDLVASPFSTPADPLLFGACYHWSTLSNLPDLVAADTLQAPAAPPDTQLFYPRGFLVDQQNRVAFQCNFLQAGPVLPTDDQALYFGTHDNMQMFLRSGSPAPQTPGYTIGLIPGPYGLSPNAGKLVMHSWLALGDDYYASQAIFAGTVGNVRRVLQQGQPLPGDPNAAIITGGMVFEAINDAGTVAGYVDLSTIGDDGRNDSAIIVVNEANQITTAARTGWPVPGAPAGINYWLLYDPPKIGENGHIAFNAWTTDLSVSPSERHALMFGLPGALQAIAYVNQQVPGMPDGVLFQNLGDIQFSSDGSRIAFNAWLKGPGIVQHINDFALFAGTPGNMRLIARRGDQATELPPGNILIDVHGFSLTDSGRLVYRCSFEGPDTPLIGNVYATGVYAEDSTFRSHLIARSGQMIEFAPGQSDFAELVFTSIDGLFGTASRGRNVLNASGQLLVMADFFDVSRLLVFQVPESCLADFDQNGSVSVNDLFAFLGAWFAQNGSAGSGLSADMDLNGSVSVNDLFAFLSEWFAHNGASC